MINREAIITELVQTSREIERLQKHRDMLEDVLRWDGLKADIQAIWQQYAVLTGRNPDEPIWWESMARGFVCDEMFLGKTAQDVLSNLQSQIEVIQNADHTR